MSCLQLQVCPFSQASLCFSATGTLTSMCMCCIHGVCLLLKGASSALHHLAMRAQDLQHLQGVANLSTGANLTPECARHQLVPLFDLQRCNRKRISVETTVVQRGSRWQFRPRQTCVRRFIQISAQRSSKTKLAASFYAETSIYRETNITQPVERDYL